MTGEISAEMPNVSAVTLIDSSGISLSSFGDVYDIGGHWMLDREMIKQSTIDYDSSTGSYLTTTARFPFLYVFNAAGELARMYRVPEFVVGRQSYFPAEGRLQIVLEDYSRIMSVSVFDRSLVVLDVLTLRNPRTEGQSRVHDAVTDY